MAKINNKDFISEDFGQPAIVALKEILKLTDELIGTLKKVGNESEGALEGLSPKDSVKDTKKLNEVLERLVETEKQLNKLTEDKKKVTADLKKLEDQKLKQDKAALDLVLKSNKAKQEEQKTLLAEQKVVQQNLRTSIARRKERERQFKARSKDRASRKKQLTEYQKESRRLTELRNRYKDLAVAEKANTKEAKDLLKEVVALDKKLKDLDETVGQNQRSVGDYGKALEGLNGAIGKLGVFAAITKVIELFVNAFGDTREGALQLEIAFSKVSESVKVLVQNIISASKGVKDFFTSFSTLDFGKVFKLIDVQSQIFSKKIDKFFIESFTGISGFIFNSINEAKKGFIELEIFLKKAEKKLTINPANLKKIDDEISNLENTLQNLESSEESPLEKAIKQIDNEISNLESSIESIKKPFSDSINSIAKAFEGTIETTSKAITEQEKFLRLQLATKISISEQEKELAGLAEQRQILQDISDDDTLSFIERKKFIDLANDAAVKFSALENKLALDKEKLTIEAIKQDLRRVSAQEKARLGITNLSIEEIKTGEQLQEILKKRDVAKKISDANDEAFNAAFIERVDKEIEVKAFQRDQEEKQRKTKRDDFEQELDIIEELGEQTIAINQKVLADQTKSLSQRRAALNKNNEQEKKIFKEGVDRIRQQGIASIQNRNDLTEAQKAERIELIKTADINAILNEQDQVKALESIKAIQLGEIETQRLKDLLKIKKDISLQNEEDAKALKEETKKTLELQEAIAIQEKKLANDKFDLEEAERKNQKENLEKRIDLLQEDSVKRLELEKQLNQLLLDEQKERLDKEKDAEEDGAEKRAELIQKSAELITNLVEKQNEKRLASIDKQISDVEERQSTLRSLAENGNEEAVKSLAESEKREAEIRREKEKELQRQQRIEAGLAAFQVFSANAQQDPETALSKTITDVTALTAFLGGLPSFFVGTEDTGKAGNSLDSNGGRLSILHDNERVMTAEQNKRIGNISNEELTRLAVDSTRGTFNNFENVSSSGPSILIGERESIKNEINELIRAVKRNKPVDPSQSFNQRTGVLSEVYQYANKKSKTHKKVFIPAKRR